MAGSYNTVNVEFEREEADALLDRLLSFGRDRGPALLRDMGEMLLSSTKDRAEREIDPDGIPWVKLSDWYAESKKEKHPGKKILRAEGNMLGDMLSYQLDGDSALDLGTNAPYGAVQQFGQLKGASGTSKRGRPIPWGDIPARPFLGVSDKDADELIRILDEHLQAAIDEA